jgi:hypothetical protein
MPIESFENIHFNISPNPLKTRLNINPINGIPSNINTSGLTVSGSSFATEIKTHIKNPTAAITPRDV